MDLIKTTKDNKTIHLLLKDHCPNQAMCNEFQTQTFALKIMKLELMEKECNGYLVDEGGAFLLASVKIKNLTNEILSVSKNDLLISYDNENPYEAEENFLVPFQLEDEIALKPDEEIKGKYIYIISDKAKRITFRFIEEYDDELVKQYKLRYSLGC